MRKASQTILSALLALLVLCPAESPARESSYYVVTTGSEKLTFVLRPELGNIY
jgi:hypothetical protein